MKHSTWYIIGFAVVIGICASAFIIAPSGTFGGSDDQGPEKILQIDPNYVVWFHSLWTPPPETESLLFAVQAAIGASIIFWFVGNEHGKKTALAGIEAQKLKAVQDEAIRKDSTTESKKGVI
jgi:cobalt/nickel transport protein